MRTSMAWMLSIAASLPEVLLRPRINDLQAAMLVAPEAGDEFAAQGYEPDLNTMLQNLIDLFWYRQM
ncbi:MAG: hypothetical protein M3Y13_07835 [Armatimonadota bacterium]|nr:hypothetical protein [Armatimonadota bacterium]